MTKKWWNPWLSIWVRPRQTIRGIIQTNPSYQVFRLAILSGIITQLSSSLARYDGLAWQIFFLTLIAGPLFGLISIYIGGSILSWSSERIGGKASTVEARAAIAWASVPFIQIIASSILLQLFFFPFMSLVQQLQLGQALGPNTALIAGFLIASAGIVIALLFTVALIWSLVIFIKCYSEVLELGIGWTMIAILMSTIILGVPSYIISRSTLWLID